MTRPSVALCPVAAALLTASPLAVLQPQVTPERSVDRRFLSELAASPDGRRLAVTVADHPTRFGRPRHIHLVDVEKATTSRLTSFTENDWSARWAPDGSTIAFLSNVDETPQIWLTAGPGATPQPLTTSSTAVNSFEWSTDGKTIVFLAEVPRTKAEDSAVAKRGDARLVHLGGQPTAAWIIDLRNRATRRLTPTPWSVTSAQWFPDGRRLLVAATDRPADGTWLGRQLMIASIDGAVRVVAKPEGPFTGERLLPGGRHASYVGSRGNGPYPHDLFRLDLETGAATNLSRSLDRLVESSSSWDRDWLLVLAQDGFRSRFYLLDGSGRSAPAEVTSLHPTGFVTLPGQRIAFFAESVEQPVEIWLGGPGRKARQLTRFNDDWRGMAVRPMTRLRYRSFDGRVIEAGLVLPAEPRPGAPLPTIALVHGGPSDRWFTAFDRETQVLAARGFAVFLPNVRGSTGYGWEHLTANRADWGGGDFRDVMVGLDTLAARGIADSTRLGISGWSYGGYLACWAITQTNRFKAAVSGAGMSDLASLFGTQEESGYDEWFLGLPYDDLGKFTDRSPVLKVRSARTPLLLVHGEADRLSPASQSWEMYQALRRLGSPVEFVLYPRAGHAFRERAQVVDRLERVVDWFVRHLEP